jgi:hypothetical protein
VKDPVLVPLGGQRLPSCALIELDLALADRRGGGRALRSRAQEIGSILLKRCPLPREEIQRHIQRACEHFELLSLPREDLGRRIGEFAQNWSHLPELYEALQTDEGRLLPRWVEHARPLEQRDPDQLRSLLHVLAQSGRPEVGVLLEELEASGSPEFSALVLRVTHRLWRAANEDRRAVLGDV